MRRWSPRLAPGLRGIGAALLLAAASPACTTVATELKVSPELIAEADSAGTVPVLVGLAGTWQPEETLSAAAVQKQRDEIDAAQSGVLAELEGSGYRLIRRYREIPALALEVGSDALTKLENTPAVANIVRDRPVTMEKSEPQEAGGVYFYAPPIERIPPGLVERAQSGDLVPVLVGLNVPWRREDSLSEAAIDSQRSAIREAQDALTAELTGSHFRVVRVYESIPAIALEIRLDALKVLERSVIVTNVLQDRPARQ